MHEGHGSDLPPEEQIKFMPPAGQPPLAPEPEAPSRARRVAPAASAASAASAEPVAPPAPVTPPAGDAATDRFTSLTAALLFVAGALHLTLVDDHLAHARGSGLFFLGVGVAQVAWSFAYLRRPTETLGRVGLAGLVLAPTLLYVLTRIVRAPWSDQPETVDLVGIVTQLTQLGAAVPLWKAWRPSVDPATARAVLGVGILLSAGLYTSALAAENVEWLGEAESEHAHGDGGHDDGHGGHGGTDFQGIRGTSLVGSVDYYGPDGGDAIADWCRDLGAPDADCWASFLKDLLTAEGSVPAFDALLELMDAEREADANSHEIAHVLGHHAYQAYGLNITLTLGECSYEVFQGCIHGALQAYFTDLATQGIPVNKDSLSGVCDASTNSFERYTCFHGVGHGVMMHTNYALHDSLETCDLLGDWFAEASCFGGVYMENVVAYFHSLDPDYVPHGHGDEPPVYWVDPDDPAYPCNVVDADYRSYCWRMQTSLILHFNDGDFRDASEACDGAGKHRLACYESLGRDAPPYADRDPERMARLCSYGADDAQQVCVKAFTSGTMLQENTPLAGVELCPQLPDEYQRTCYKEVGNQADSMLSEAEAKAVCDGLPEEWVAVCHEGRK